MSGVVIDEDPEEKGRSEEEVQKALVQMESLDEQQMVESMKGQ